MHRNEVTNFYYRIKCQKKKNRNLNPMSPDAPEFTFIIPSFKKQTQQKGEKQSF